MTAGIRVTVEDLETGEKSERVINNDYIIVTAGNKYVDGFTNYSNGTAVVTIKTQKAPVEVSLP